MFDNLAAPAEKPCKKPGVDRREKEFDLAYSILFDCRPVRDPISGVARYCLGVVEALVRSEGPQPDLFVQAQRGVNEFLSLLPDRARQVHARIAPGDRRIQNALLEFLPVTQPLLFGWGHDILHETYFADLGRRRGAVKVATIHDVIPLERPELFSKRNVAFSTRNFHRQAREADVIISVSEYTRQRILDFVPSAEDRIVVIGNGVDPGIVSGPKVAPLAADDPLAGRPYVGHLGNIEPRKNLLTLARAFDQAFPAGSEWRLVLAGRRNFEADKILGAIEALLGERFCYLGPVSEERKWQVIAHAQAMAMPSEYEGFGIPIYESYAVRTPIMIADNSSMTELAMRPEQLFSTFDAEALAEGLRQIAAGADWIAPSLDAGYAVVQGATWDKIAAETRKVYERLC
ncbi:MAG: hypothetical protein CMN19_04865 [Roseovarius sp.]|nr:hypothetical protein [Roseovarius sp.]